jgi:hypothetical protein
MSGSMCRSIVSNGAIQAAPSNLLRSGLQETFVTADGWFGITAIDHWETPR